MIVENWNITEDSFSNVWMDVNNTPQLLENPLFVSGELGFDAVHILPPVLKKIILSNSFITCVWEDGTATTIAFPQGQVFEEEVVLPMCYLKKTFGEEFISNMFKMDKVELQRLKE